MFGSNTRCRFCEHPLQVEMVDLGDSPLANSFLRSDGEPFQERTYPLKVYVCEHCLLVQLSHFVDPAHIFKEYAYFSSYSSSWIEHAKRYVEFMVRSFGVNSNWQVLEIGSNDGYLLQHFLKHRIPVLGIEPAVNVAQVANQKGIETRSDFFNLNLAKQLKQEGKQADLLIANNVMAHIPDIQDFVASVKFILSPRGIATFEVPHLLNLIKQTEFDTIYHEHYYYFSLLTLDRVFKAHDLSIFEVEELSVHGGSLRIFVKHRSEGDDSKRPSVVQLLQKECESGLDRLETYQNFSKKVVHLKNDLIHFLKTHKQRGKHIACYGAPAKGNTLLSYCGIDQQLIDFTVDKNPAKQNCLLPGSHIPVYRVEKIFETKPDYVLILPWNLEEEITHEMDPIRSWGGHFVIPIPEIRVI